MSSQEGPRPGLAQFQVPLSTLRVEASFEIGGDADWVAVTDDAVWAASSSPRAARSIDPRGNTLAASVDLPGDPFSGMVAGFGSLWVPLCGGTPSLARIDLARNELTALLPIGPGAEEGGIAASDDSIWLAVDAQGSLARIDPATNTVRQTVRIAPGSYNPVHGAGIVWVTGHDDDVLTAVDARTGTVLGTTEVGPRPRFLTAGGGSIWTLNQGDGSVTRVDMRTRDVVATIALGVPGTGGDIAWGAGHAWVSVFDVPLTAIDAATNAVRRQWVGVGGDSLRIGHGAIWLNDLRAGRLSRIALADALPVTQR
jgi:virginiamycin B lyase